MLFCLHGSFSTWKALESFLALWGEVENPVAVPDTGCRELIPLPVGMPAHEAMWGVGSARNVFMQT